jgi:hypothetical protein
VKESFIDFRSKIYIYNHEGYPYINDNVYLYYLSIFLIFFMKEKKLKKLLIKNLFFRCQFFL